MSTLRDRLSDFLEPIDADDKLAIDFSTRSVALSPRAATAAVAIAVAVALGALAALWWPAGESATMPTPVPAESAVAQATHGSAAAPGSVGPSPSTSEPAPTASGPLIVSVVGLVHRPGVVEVRAGARVIEAIDKAGGLLPEANPASVNLAAPLADGQQIVVGLEPATTGPVPGAGSGGPQAAGGARDSAGSGSGAININTATATQLEELPGIGPATAAKIVGHREKNGPFPSVDALEEVPGIGPAKIEALRDAATV
nr:ComEA family DNA-binding protein [Corynebacterium lactis]